MQQGRNFGHLVHANDDGAAVIAAGADDFLEPRRGKKCKRPAPAIAHHADLAGRLDEIDRGLGIEQALLERNFRPQRSPGRDAFRIIAVFGARLGAVGYYGSQIVDGVREVPKVPTMLHFGDSDASIPLRDVETIRQARPELAIYVYPGKHGFNCDARANYVPASAQIAFGRTLEFLGRHVG